MAVSVTVAPFVVLAASEEQSEQTSLLWSLSWSFVPILFIGLIVRFFFVRGIRNHQRPMIERDRQIWSGLSNCSSEVREPWRRMIMAGSDPSMEAVCARLANKNDLEQSHVHRAARPPFAARPSLHKGRMKSSAAEARCRGPVIAVKALLVPWIGCVMGFV